MRALTLIGLVVFTGYAPVELTRVIISYRITTNYWPTDPTWHAYFEIAFIWFFYLVALIGVYLVLTKLKPERG